MGAQHVDHDYYGITMVSTHPLSWSWISFGNAEWVHNNPLSWSTALLYTSSGNNGCITLLVCSLGSKIGQRPTDNGQGSLPAIAKATWAGESSQLAHHARCGSSTLVMKFEHNGLHNGHCSSWNDHCEDWLWWENCYMLSIWFII